MSTTDPQELFHDRLEAALKDAQTRRSLKEIDPVNVDRAEHVIRVVVLEARKAILQETNAFHVGWLEAIRRHEMASAALLPARRRLRRVTRWSLGVVAAGVIGISAWAIASDDAGILALLVFLASGAYLPWVNAWEAVGVLRRELRIADRERDTKAARRRYLTVLGDEVTAATRRAINAKLESFQPAFRIIDVRGLRDLADPEREVQIAATMHLRTLMKSIDSGSIGLSGPRGCGKTTLIHSFATGRSLLPNERERRGLVVSAPVRYDARDFLMHMFGTVCERILNPVGTSAAPVPLSRQLRVARIRALSGFLIVIGGIFAATGLAMLLTDRTTPSGPAETGGLLLILAVVSLYVGLPMWLGSTGRTALLARLLVSRAMRKKKTDEEHEDQQAGGGGMPNVNYERNAEQQLEEIRFQQSLASGWTGTVGLPLGASLGGDSKLTVTRTPWTLPEVVDRYRAYVATLTDQYYLVLGIDELDKMESEEAARRFLNDIKGVFGVRGCYYLVSVSEDAMSSFERRGLPFRDVFDSSFDAIQRVDYLTLEESREVLQSRVTGLPVPYQCLCHCLAGGLPRDLIRVARELVHQQAECESVSLAELTRAVVGSELRGKVAAAMVAGRATSGLQREWVLSWIQRQDVGDPDLRRLEASYQELLEWPALQSAEAEPEGDGRLREIAVELTAFSHYAATLLEFFASDEDQLISFLVGDTSPPRLCGEAEEAIAALARARQQFTSSPWLAAAEVTRFRALASLTPRTGLWHPLPVRTTALT